MQLKPSNGNSLLTTSGLKSVAVVATGYSDAAVTQQINAGAPTSNSTATIDLPLALNSTRTVTASAKDQYNNMVPGYIFNMMQLLLITLPPPMKLIPLMVLEEMHLYRTLI